MRAKPSEQLPGIPRDRHKVKGAVPGTLMEMGAQNQDLKDTQGLGHSPFSLWAERAQHETPQRKGDNGEDKESGAFLLKKDHNLKPGMVVPLL